MSYLPSDKLHVFISSRLGECKAERKIAREVIDSLGHQPVMFEAAGARPHAPRSVYLRGLEESQIFIGIYREGYGYIAPDMDISGLEDEYRHAGSLGIPCLLYVLRGASTEARLQALVDEFTGPDLTVAYYEQAAELNDRIRADLVALVSDYFRRGQSYTGTTPTDPGLIADALAPAEKRIRREHLEQSLENQLKKDPVALTIGPLGSGKTVFLSDLSQRNKWAFVHCGEKSPLEVLADATNSIRGLIGLPTKAFLLVSEAQSSLQSVWNASTAVTLVLDDLRNAETLEYLRSVAPVSNSHRLVISSRESVPTSGLMFELPPLDLDEIRRFVELNRSDPLMPGELVEIERMSEGNPLYLRYYLAGEPGEFASNLAEYETRVWTALSAEVHEVLAYLAWASRPLSLEELSELVTGAPSSVETLADTIESGTSLLLQSNRGYSIFHPHAAETIQSLTRRSRPRLKFYVERLSKWFVDNRDYSAAFSALDLAGFAASQKLLDMAARQTVVKGDLRTAIKILTIQVDCARSSGDQTGERDLLLYLGQILSLAGSPDEALKMIDLAALIRTDSPPPIELSEIRAIIAAHAKGDRDSFTRLVSRRDRYRDSGDVWNAARLSLDICAYYIRQDEPGDAVNEASFAMQGFQECEDEYGLRLAKTNYLSAISALPDRAEEADALTAEMEADRDDAPQQRAILCNVLGRRARERNDTASARVYAREAIEIGRALGDNSILCNNLINLGNAYRQEGNWDSAIAQYEAADKLARESNLPVVEASAQERLASVFNRKGDSARAVHHALYAISTARRVSRRTESDATEELAQAYESASKSNEARDAWLKYAALESDRVADVEASSYGFVRAASIISRQTDLQAYIDAYRRLFAGPFSTTDDFSLGELLLEDFTVLFGQLSLPCIFDAAAYHAGFMFKGMPNPFVRRLYRVAMRLLFAADASRETVPLKRLRVALAFAMALPKDSLQLGDIVDVGEWISHAHTNVSFRARPDGAAHWTVELQLGKPIIVTVFQIDDRPDVSLIALCIVLVLVAFAPDILEDVVSGSAPERDEASIQVCNFSEAQAMFPLDKIGLESLPEGCAVTRATDVKRDASAPVLVLTSDTLTENWLVGSGSANRGQELFAHVLGELVYFLQAGEIEMESLAPKIGHVVARTIV